MGITSDSTGKNALKSNLQPKNGFTVALAGNPNVGKSTVFNALTGMHQHTGNWAGKTVSNAQGTFSTDKRSYNLVDIPGTYSLTAHSAEEEIARNFICFDSPDAVIVVCDATCLERNMNLVLQALEITDNVIVCINLMDEAEKRGIKIDADILSKRLGVPVVSITARKKKSLKALLSALDNFASSEGFKAQYPDAFEEAISVIMKSLTDSEEYPVHKRRIALSLLDSDTAFKEEFIRRTGNDISSEPEVCRAVSEARYILDNAGIPFEKIGDVISEGLVENARKICDGAVTGGGKYGKSDRYFDKILTSRATGYPVMVLMLIFIFWLTVTGANYPSQLLSDLLFGIQDKLSALFYSLNAPQWLHDSLILGVYRVTAWIVSVMLPPMAIFFPLFSLLEDSGYLPRIAYNLDKPFRLCNACGKQALTMCMGFGCNAAGIVGCRIIDSPRERLLAILTNSFVPCNGKFPTLITLITVFFVGSSSGLLSSFTSAVMLTAVILTGIAATFLATKLLSETVLKGVPSAFTLELPSYRRPKIIETLIRSVLDRTVFVLSRAVAIAAPAGLIIWLSANITIGGTSILSHCADFLDPFARLMGLDGVILIAFILGFPANEIVIPVMLMAYYSLGTLPDLGTSAEIGALLLKNGWTKATALCVIIFSLMHFPCSTTLLTVRKETGSIKYTVLAAVLPTVMGIIACIIVAEVARVTGFC